MKKKSEFFQISTYTSFHIVNDVISFFFFTGNITDLHLEKKAEEWIEKKTGANVEFDSSEAVKHLQDFGILSVSNGKLNVLPLDAAMRNLPQQPTLRVERMEEDVLEEMIGTIS